MSTHRNPKKHMQSNTTTSPSPSITSSSPASKKKKTSIIPSQLNAKSNPISSEQYIQFRHFPSSSGVTKELSKLLNDIAVGCLINPLMAKLFEEVQV